MFYDIQPSHLEAENKRERKADPEMWRTWKKSLHGRLEHPALLLCSFVVLPGYRISLFNSHALGYYVCHGPSDRTDFWFLKNIIGHRYHISANRMYIRKIVGGRWEGGSRGRRRVYLWLIHIDV